MELQIYQINGSETGRTVALDASVFGVEPNDHVLWLDVRRTQASRRQGTHKAKERGEITGSTRKLYRQKGTGLARAGSAKSPLRRSGGTIFGPRPRAYEIKLNKKTRQLARRSALSYKAQEDAIRVIERFAFDAPSTSRLVGIIEALNLADQRVLVLTEQNDTALYRSSCNLEKVDVLEARNASAEQLLGAGVLLLEEGAVAQLAETLGGISYPKAEATPVAPVEEEEAPEATPTAPVAEVDDEPAAEAAPEVADEPVAEAADEPAAEEASEEEDKEDNA